MSGAEAAKGACPAHAYGTPPSAVAASSTVSTAMRFISRLLHKVRGLAGFPIAGFRGRDLVWRGRGRWQWFANGKPHRGDLLQLSHDDFLGHALKLLVAPVTQLGPRHLDRTLMVRDHHRHEIDVDVAGRPYAHVDHHFRHSSDVLGEIRRLCGGCGPKRCRADRGDIARE